VSDSVTYPGRVLVPVCGVVSDARFLDNPPLNAVQSLCCSPPSWLCPALAGLFSLFLCFLHREVGCVAPRYARRVAERIVVFVDYQNAYLTGCDVYAAGDARHRHVPHPGRLGDAIAAARRRPSVLAEVRVHRGMTGR
jgi:hypothetical protein